jgi:hypothetical protein
MSHFSEKANNENLDCFEGNHMHKLERVMGGGGGGCEDESAEVPSSYV